MSNDSSGNLVITSRGKSARANFIFDSTPGEYVLCVRFVGTTSSTLTTEAIRIYDVSHSWAPILFFKQQVGQNIVKFTVPSGCTPTCVQFWTGPTSGDTSTWSDYEVVSASDWQAMQALGVTWFDGDSQSPQPNAGLAFPLDFGQTGNTGNTGMIVNNGSYVSTPIITAHGGLDSGLTIHWNTSDGNEGDLSYKGSIQNVPVTINTDTHSAIMGGLDVSYQLGSRDWPRIPAGGSCSFALLASGNGWVTVQSHDTYM